MFNAQPLTLNGKSYLVVVQQELAGVEEIDQLYHQAETSGIGVILLPVGCDLAVTNGYSFKRNIDGQSYELTFKTHEELMAWIAKKESDTKAP